MVTVASLEMHGLVLLAMLVQRRVHILFLPSLLVILVPLLLAALLQLALLQVAALFLPFLLLIQHRRGLPLAAADDVLIVVAAAAPPLQMGRLSRDGLRRIPSGHVGICITADATRSASTSLVSRGVLTLSLG